MENYVEIDPVQSSTKLETLFDRWMPYRPRLFSVLEGCHKVRALVDDIANPTWCVLRSGWNGWTFIPFETTTYGSGTI